MRYFYIPFASPFGFSSYFYRGEKHPLDPKTYAEKTKMLADQYFIKFHQLINPSDITFLSLTELPREVAKAKWPEDFGETLMSLKQVSDLVNDLVPA